MRVYISMILLKNFFFSNVNFWDYLESGLWSVFGWWLVNAASPGLSKTDGWMRQHTWGVSANQCTHDKLAITTHTQRELWHVSLKGLFTVANVSFNTKAGCWCECHHWHYKTATCREPSQEVFCQFIITRPFSMLWNAQFTCMGLPDFRRSIILR